MDASVTKQMSAWIPIAMSGAAILTVICHIAFYGTAPQPDEGAAAHIWQLLMAGQVPVLVFFAIKWLPRTPKTALKILGAQIGAAVAALAPVYFLGW
jgi:hypothetical protein